eukprot:4416745-Prymnesium_polylepis.1
MSRAAWRRSSATADACWLGRILDRADGLVARARSTNGCHMTRGRGFPQDRTVVCVWTPPRGALCAPCVSVTVRIGELCAGCVQL